MTVSKEGAKLDRDSERWRQIMGAQRSLVLREKPKDPAEWKVRLQHVEKRVARAIITAPVAFSCVVKPSKGKREDTVIRFAFGLSLSLGLACQRRYTAYYVPDTKRSFYLAGQDQLFEVGSDFGPANPGSKESINGLRQILELVPKVVSEYQESGLVTEQIRVLDKVLSHELRSLGWLYLATSNQYPTLLGNSSDLAVKGDDAVELEYLNKLEDIVSRFKVSVRFAPLSLAIVRCHINAKAKRGGTDITIPFVDQPFLIGS
jgi:hypothetical protein